MCLSFINNSMLNNEFYINLDNCSKCGTCIEVCPASVLSKNESGNVYFKSDFISICLGCGQCMAVCKTKSIYVKGLDYSSNFYEITENDDIFSVIERRRSVRRFKPKPVDKELINKILEAISNAPHGHSHHNVEITIVNNREKIMEGLYLISNFYDNLAKKIYNPIIRKIIEFETGEDTINTLKNHLVPRIQKGIYSKITYEYDGITRGAHTLFLFHARKDSEEHKEDSYVLVTYATLTAQALGLGSTIIGLIAPAINKIPELKRMYNIPKNHEVVVSLILGYPKFKYHRGIKRELKKISWIE